MEFQSALRVHSVCAAPRKRQMLKIRTLSVILGLSTFLGSLPASAEDGSAQVGHHDGGNTSWNSAHASRGCSQEALVTTGGAGKFYCFAAD